MTDPANVPPGWYSGGVEGELRWWDGATWTEHVRPSAPAPVGGIRWSGNADVSLIAGIVVVVLAMPFYLLAFFGIFSGHIENVLLPGFGALVLTALGALAIVNSFGVRKQNAAAAAHSAALRNPPGA